MDTTPKRPGAECSPLTRRSHLQRDPAKAYERRTR